MNYFYEPPSFIQKLFWNFIWETSNNKILLTIDDGPSGAATLKILSVLRANKIKSIFFCVGNNVLKHHTLAEKILEDGHTIANHTMNHKLLTSIKREEAVEEISTFNDLMKEKFSYKIKYFRPPHGRFNLKTGSLIKEMNLKCVMWNLLSHDYENKLEKVKYGVDKYLKENSIVVFHDNIKCCENIESSLNYAIEVATKKGYGFGEPENCLK